MTLELEKLWADWTQEHDFIDESFMKEYIQGLEDDKLKFQKRKERLKEVTEKLIKITAI